MRVVEKNFLPSLLACLPFLAFLFVPHAALAGLNTYTGHGSFSVTSAVSVTESAPVRFGNFSVSDPGDNGARLVLGSDGARTVHKTGVTAITLLNGGYADAGAQGEGRYSITGAGNGATLYITFTDHAGADITPGNPIILRGPVGSDEFYVDNFTFNLDGTDGTGDFIIASGTGTAVVRVGATLHTKTGATTYAPGKYQGTFEIMVSY